MVGNIYYKFLAAKHSLERLSVVVFPFVLLQTFWCTMSTTLLHKYTYILVLFHTNLLFMTLLFYLPFYTSIRVIFKAFCSGLGVIYSQFLTNLMAVYLFRAKNAGHFVIYLYVTK